MVLDRLDYNAAYFGDDSERNGSRHDAGYSDYLDIVKEKPYLRRANRVFSTVSGKILELGCGIGTYAKIAKDAGFNWTALDFSDWCYRHRETRIIKQDALSYLKAQRDNSFDYIVSWGFIECLSDEELRIMKTEMDRVATNQMHLSYKNPNSLYYNTEVKTRIDGVLNIIG